MKKRIRLTKKMFTQILKIPNSGPFYKVSTEQIIYMFNEMGRQPPLIKISDFKKSGLPCIWNFLFGIYLHCLTGRSVRLDKGRLEVYAMVVGIYYDLNVDYATQVQKDFIKSLENTNVVKGISCARYWSLVLQSVYEKEGIPVPANEAKAEFMKYHFPKSVEDDSEVFPNVARITDRMLKKIDPTNSVLVKYLKRINPSVKTRVFTENK